MGSRTLDGGGLTTLQNFWIKHARQCKNLSGGLVKEYALKNGLNPQDLYRWRSWFRKRGMLEAMEQVVPTFQSLTVVKQESSGSDYLNNALWNDVVVQLPNRVRIEFSWAMDLVTLGALFHHVAGLP
ncbi:MAG: hypothetical protein HQL79_08525 [Magnetococcales bacterium]|nr:hypothetical protein [Magnetococcales bacterium]